MHPSAPHADERRGTGPHISVMKVLALAGVLSQAVIDRSLPADLRAAIRRAPPAGEERPGRHRATWRLTCETFPAGVFVKTFQPSAYYNAVRVLAAKSVLRRAGIGVAETLGTALLRRGRTPVLAICEAPCPGTPYRLHRWSTATARALGADFARWHGADLSPRDAAIFRATLVRPPSRPFWRDVESVLGEDRGALGTIGDQLARLRDPAFRGPQALCQWDLGGRNILIEPDRRLWWLDLDRTAVIPTRANLADLVLRMAESDEGRPHIDSVLDAYFAARPDERDAWHRDRAAWLRIRTAIDLLNIWWWDRRGLTAIRNTPAHRLGQAIAAFALEDQGGPTGDLMARFDRHRRAVGEELELAGWPGPTRAGTA